MPAQKPENPRSKLDLLICELLNAQDSSIMLERCLSKKPKNLAAIPLRYRLIMLGFVQSMSLDALNKKLLENGCARLYARSFYEATLIYTFSKGLSYDEWKTLQVDCSDLRAQIASKDSALNESTVSLRDILRYVDDRSSQEEAVAQTIHETQVLEQQILGLKDDRQDFRLFILSNIHSFSEAREKTRYYFCKYLAYYLRTRIDDYLSQLERGNWKGAALEELSVFRATKKLSRRKHTAAQAAAVLEESPLSPGGIYGAFSTFYFDYITVDWSEILLEIYCDPEEMPVRTRRRLAQAIRAEMKDDPAQKAGNRQNTEDSDLAVIRRKILALEQEEEEPGGAPRGDAAAAGYQKGRMGKNFITNILQGVVDLDRSSFIAFLLFLGRQARIPAQHRIDALRLDGILKECGFTQLSEEEPFDDFALRFMVDPDPMELVQKEAELLAERGENFYLYKTYNASKSASRKWRELL